MSQSMVDIRAQFSRMSTFMMDMAKKMDAVFSRCDGVPPEVNFSQHARNNQQGSEFSSETGDPSQAAQSDNSRTVSQLSSAGKRSIVATQGQSSPPNEVAQLQLRSPIKKKQRARDFLDSQPPDSNDVTSASDDQTKVNPETRFNQSFEANADEAEMDYEATGSETTQENTDASTIPAPPNSQHQYSPPPPRPPTASPDHQYNKANGSAEAHPE